MPSVFIDDATIDRWIAEDAPLLDLTTHLLAIGDRRARMRVRLRPGGVVAATEEAGRIVMRCGGDIVSRMPSGGRAAAGAVILEATGPADALLRSWKVAQNLLEYACGVAAATDAMVRAVHAVAPRVAVLTTRKHAPGLRALALKATLAAGAFPHRLGLSETVLVFPQHRALLAGWDDLRSRLMATGHAVAEKKIVIEAESLEDAWSAIAAGADVIQFDKASTGQLQDWCSEIRRGAPAIGLLAAGGIRPDNAAEYARTGVDALVTSSLHHAPPADVGVQFSDAASTD